MTTDITNRLKRTRAPRAVGIAILTGLCGVLAAIPFYLSPLNPFIIATWTIIAVGVGVYIAFRTFNRSKSYERHQQNAAITTLLLAFGIALIPLYQEVPGYIIIAIIFTLFADEFRRKKGTQQ